MKFNPKDKEYLLDLGISQSTLNIFDANCEDLALEILKLYAGLKKDEPIDTAEAREALINTYVKTNPEVQYLKKDVILEPEIVTIQPKDKPEELDESQDLTRIIENLEYMDTLSAKDLKIFIIDELSTEDFEMITNNELTKEEVELMSSGKVKEEMDLYFDGWEYSLGQPDKNSDSNEDFEVNPNYLEPDFNESFKYDDFSYMPYAQRLFKQSPEDRFNNSIQSTLRYVMDYISNPKTSKGLGGELNEQTFEELEDASNKWHRSLYTVKRILLVPTNNGDDIISDIDTEETNQILIDYRIGGKGYYWANLNEHFSAQEQRRMSHCGRCMHTLYSFRSTLDATVTGIPNHEDVVDRMELFTDNKLEGHTVTRSHVTVSVGSDGIIYQMKAAENEKVPVEFHKYIIDILIAENLSVLGATIPKIKGFGFEYNNGNDFSFDQMRDSSLITKLYKARKDLFTDGSRNMSDKEMETFMTQFNLTYEGPSKESAQKFNYWDKPKNYVMTEREKKEEDDEIERRKKWKTRPNLWGETAKEPQQKSWFKEETSEMGWEKAEYVYILKSGEEKKYPCKYDSFLNIVTDIDDDELFQEMDSNDEIKEEYILYMNKKVKDAKLEL